MTDAAEQKKEDDDSLWRAVYTSGKGWSDGTVFADHHSVGSPALALVDGTLYCAHLDSSRAALWTAFSPAQVQPFIEVVEKAGKPLPKGASEQDKAQRDTRIKAAADALTAARKWTPDTKAGFTTELTPVLVDDNGTLRMLHDHISGGTTSLWEREFAGKDGKGAWSGPVDKIGANWSAQAVAVFNDAVHLVCVHNYKSLVHQVRHADGHWRPATKADGTPVPSVSFGKNIYSNMSLAVHDGQLHLLASTSFNPQGMGMVESGDLLHTVFDGNTWTEPKKIADAPRARDGAGLASYDGRLHAVYPLSDSDALRHLTWTKKDGWSKGENIKGRESNHAPALLTFSSGPKGAETEALMLVGRGIWRAPERVFVELPEPVQEPKPAPSTMADVTSRGTLTSGPKVTDYGNGAWSRVSHQVSLTPATLKNGNKALIATWDATAQYYWGAAHYRDGKAWIQGTLWLNKEGSKLFLQHADFHESCDSKGNLHIEVLFPDLEPGTYILTNSSSKTIKTGGYWAGSNLSYNRDDDDDHNFWSRVECSKGKVTITL
ncbi:hypothetical protein ACWEQJ_23205 [Streptomyces cyaneofuscatus]